MSKKPPSFNNPFAQLKQLVNSRPALLPAQSGQSAQPAPQPTAAQAPDEAELFKQAMRGVRGLDKAKGRAVVLEQTIAPFVPVDDELEVMAHLAELVAGEEGICLSWRKDFVRGANSKVSPQLLDMLEQGRFPIQAYLDLHGFSVDEALRQVEEFLRNSRARGLRHVLLVHGKGKGSAGGESVLKETLSHCLCHKRFARWVLAFCNARSQDGGVGAMYVLLKTWQGPTIFAPKPTKIP